MKNHELLDMIGDVNEDYVRAAGGNVVRPRFRWKAFTAVAACAVLAVGVYSVWQAARPRDLPLQMTVPLHGYTIVESGGTLTTEGDIKAPDGDIPLPDPIPGGGDTGRQDIDGTEYSALGQDAPAQEEAAAQYDNLLKSGGINPADGPNPEWYGGAWIDNDWPDNVGRLTVAIVDGFRTDELEAQILDWCGGTGDVLFCDAKYSLAHLYALQDPAVDAITGKSGGLSCGIGVDVIENCLGVDLYGDGAEIPDSVLIKLAELDPAGDAIRVRVFTQSMSTLTDEVKKGPVPGGMTEPVFDGARVEPGIEAGPAPDPVQDGEWTMPAAEPGTIEDLPQAK